MPIITWAKKSSSKDTYCDYMAGPSLEQVPRVPGTREFLSSYVMAPVNLYEISREQLPGTCKILRPLICGTRGLKGDKAGF